MRVTHARYVVKKGGRPPRTIAFANTCVCIPTPWGPFFSVYSKPSSWAQHMSSSSRKESCRGENGTPLPLLILRSIIVSTVCKVYRCIMCLTPCRSLCVAYAKNARLGYRRRETVQRFRRQAAQPPERLVRATTRVATER